MLQQLVRILVRGLGASCIEQLHKAGMLLRNRATYINLRDRGWEQNHVSMRHVLFRAYKWNDTVMLLDNSL